MEDSRRLRRLALAAVVAVPLLAVVVDIATGIPVFSRKYKTSCSTCHYAFPQLNAFGKAFLNNGFRYPGDDESIRKEDPVSLGSEGNKQAWPDAIWPSDIPGTAPFAIHAVGFYQRSFHQPDSVAGGVIQFPSEAHILYGGTLGENFSFFGAVEAEMSDGAADVGFPFILQLNQSPGFNVSVGSMHFDPSPGDQGLLPKDYNISDVTSRNGWVASGEQPGVELWGAGNGAGGKGGWKYTVGVVNGQGTGSGVGQDYFARGSYKIGGLGEIGGTEGQASNTSAFYIDNSATLGALVYSGHVGGATFAQREKITVWGGSADIWLDRLILNGTVMGMKSVIDSTADRSSLAWYAQGQYVVYPWLIGLLRIESTRLDTNDPAAAQTTLTPGVVVMVRANVKATLEYTRPLSDYDARKMDEEQLVAKLDFAL
jgi:hypothetical protein